MKAIIDDPDFTDKLFIKCDEPRSFDQENVTPKQAVISGYPYLKEQVKGDLKRNGSHLYQMYGTI